MKVYIFLILFALMFAACSNEKIEITSDYIINEFWNKDDEQVGANSIQVKKMKVKKDSLLNPYSDLSQAEILSKLEYDSSFIFVANIKIQPGESYKNKKIYFDKDNGFYWWTDHGNRKTKILGKLEINNWYEISNLRPYPYYIIYIDSTDTAHNFDINVANY